jgi:predicted AlkP superfamily phosphohydrolase/phosphomutase
MKLVVIGLDGAHFELINPWLESNELPNIKRVMEKGLYADMEVCLPPVTSPNWKCYSTGKNPAKLGIFWWENIDTKGKRVYYPGERKNEQREIWDYLGDAGYRVCVIGTPLTYPPKKVNGIMISGALDSTENGFTYPGELEEELKRRYDYRVHPEHNIRVDRKQAIEDMHELIDLRFRVALDLMEEQGDFDFVQTSTYYLNILQHFLWDDDATKQGWKIVDRYVGKLLRKEPETNLIFMSDHGSNRIKTTFNINSWLEKEGYLRYNSRYKLAKSLSRIGINKENLEWLSEKLSLRPLLKSLVPGRVIQEIPTREGRFGKEAKSDKVDWDKSDAVASGQGPVYVMNKARLAEIKRKLEELETPEGKAVLNGVFAKDEIYDGQYIDEAPDLVMDQSPNIHITGRVGGRDIFGRPDIWKAENKKTGLFIACGPDFKAGGKLESVSILDLAPTILALYGIEKPQDMDGKVRDEVFFGR